MGYWLRNRAVAAVVGALLLAELVAVVTVRSRFQLPSLVGLQGLEVPVGFFLPLEAIVGFGVAMERRPALLEDRGVRPVRLWDCLLVVVLVALVALPAVAQGAEPWLGAALATATGLGMVMSLRRLPAYARALVPCGWIFTGVLTGRNYGHDAWWNWPVAPWNSPVAWGWAVLALGLGVVVHARRR